MNVAVCYRGYLRTISQTFDNHKKFLFKNNNIDCFVHTWAEYHDEINYVKSIIKPKNILIEEPKELEIHPYDSLFFEQVKPKNNFNKEIKLSCNRLHSRPYNTLSMLYSLMMSNNISKISDKKYDLVISLRPDIIFYDEINLESLDKNNLNISWFENIGDHLKDSNAMIDHMAIGSPEIMNRYSDCFLYVPSYYFNLGVPIVPEIMLGFHSKTVNKISVNMINSRHSVIRIRDYNENNNINK